MEKEFLMSYFNAPITNKVPLRTVSLLEVAQMVRSTWLEPQTKTLRRLAEPVSARNYKGWQFPYVTPAGVFSDSKWLYGVNVFGLKQKLIADRLFRTLIAFRSPSGNGLKWFIEIDLGKCSHRQWFDAVRNYLMTVYGLSPKQADPSVRNESRACFLCYDPEVYVNPSLLTTDR